MGTGSREENASKQDSRATVPIRSERKRLWTARTKVMQSATSEVQVDTAEVRVTQWRLAPGSATGHHIHEMDYVIVPVTAGEMTIVSPDGERSKAQLAAGKSYFRKAGVEHDVLNESAAEIVFLEVELKP
jgi:quercetin dioxygenase-like cupin family protein